MGTVERILQFIDYKGFNQQKKGKSLRAFYDLCDIPNGSFKVGRSVGSENLEKIFYKFPDINIDWVITGRGDMVLQEKAENYVLNDVGVQYLSKKEDWREKYYTLLEKYNNCLEQQAGTQSHTG